MRSIAEALHAMLPAFSPLGEEEVALSRAMGRFVARDVLAELDLRPEWLEIELSERGVLNQRPEVDRKSVV